MAGFGLYFSAFTPTSVSLLVYAGMSWALMQIHAICVHVVQIHAISVQARVGLIRELLCDEDESNKNQNVEEFVETEKRNLETTMMASNLRDIRKCNMEAKGLKEELQKNLE
jgi:hypothetical protein